MRICLTVPSLDKRFGGPIASAFGLAKGIKANGHEVVIVGCGTEGADIATPPLGRFHSTPIPRRLSPTRAAVRSADVVHVLGYRDPIGTVAMLTAKKAGIPYFFEPLGMYRPVERSFYLKNIFERSIGARLVRGAAGIVVTSSLEADHFSGSTLRSQVHLRPNGVDESELVTDLPTGSMRSRFGVPSEANLLVSLARITQKKRIDHLIDALELLPEDCWLLIVGPNALDGGLEVVLNRRDSSPARERVIVHPEGLWNDERTRVLLDSDCFCLPSAWETSAIATLEAAALELPVVVSDRCGGAEYLGKSGFVVPFGDIEATAQAIMKAYIIKKQEPSSLQAEAKRIRRDLNWSSIGRRQIEIYESAFASAGT